MKATSIC